MQAIKMGNAGVHTINALIDSARDKFADRPAVGFAFENPLTYAEFHARILSLAAWLKKAGINHGDRVAILGENSAAWGIAYFATVRLGAIAVPILPDFPEADVKHILAETRAKIIFATQRQLEKLYDFTAHALKHIVTLDNSSDPNSILSTNEFSAILKAAPTEQPLPAAKESDIASIIYTSGTSGHSKGVMLTHANFWANVDSADGIVTCRPDWKFLSILPMSHAYEFTICFLFPLKNGARIIYAGKTPTPTVLEKICKAERPNIMGMVPMVMEKIYKKRVLSAINRSKLLKTAMRFNFTRRRILHAAGKKLLAFFGGNLELIAIGGASLNLEVETFLAEAKFPYIIGYGLTESAPLLCGGPLADPTIALGSTGKPVPNVEIRIKNPEPATGIGDIVARGANIMKEYFNNKEATAETIDKDGWLATGDLGYFDAQGNLHITGRSKSVIVLSHGENIYPEPIEEKINSYQHVVESLVVANGDRLESWVYLDYELIDEETRGQNDRQKREYIAELLKRIQREVNPQLPPYSQLARFVERSEPFIKTATHKIKRYLYSQRIESP